MAEKSESHRRRDILHVAAGLFRHRGYERTSVRQIADALGIKSGSLFYHFASKEEILVAVMEEGIRDVFGAVQLGVAKERELPRRLLAMVRCHLAGLLGPNLDALMVLVYEWRSLSAPAMRRVLEWRNRYEDLWDRELSAAAAWRWGRADSTTPRPGRTSGASRRAAAATAQHRPRGGTCGATSAGGWKCTGRTRSGS